MPKKEKPEILVYFLDDLLGQYDGFSYKSMFGGYSIYRFGKIFAILIDDEFYFKVGENNIDDYLKVGSNPFRYEAKGKLLQMNYYKIPENILEDREELLSWIDKSLKVESKTKSKPKVKTDELTKKVLNYIKTIPVGKVSTYKLLANKFQVHPRVISSIMKYNKEPLVYPCYKVVADSGKLSGYNTIRGVDEKVEKLKNEGIEIKDGKIDKKYFYIN